MICYFYKTLKSVSISLNLRKSFHITRFIFYFNVGLFSFIWFIYGITCNNMHNFSKIFCGKILSAFLYSQKKKKKKNKKKSRTFKFSFVICKFWGNKGLSQDNLRGIDNVEKPRKIHIPKQRICSKPLKIFLTATNVVIV